MTVKKGESDRREGKGFAGLSSLVSEVDATAPASAKREAAGSDTSSGTEPPTASKNAQPEPQPARQQPDNAPPPPPSDSSAGKWILGIGAVIGVLWLIGQAPKSPSPPAPSSSPSARNIAPLDSSAPAQPQAPSHPNETKPPVGQNLILSVAKIRYCLAEDIRMDGAKSALNNYSDSDVDRFNAMVADYNSRCGSFRYRSGALERARRDVEPYRSQLQAEGRRRFARASSTGSLSTPASTRSAADATVQAVQQKLNELGYNAGPVDGLMGRRTRSAIVAFQQDSDLQPDGHPGAGLLAKLNSAATAISTSNISRTNRVESSSPKLATPTRSAPTALPSQSIQPSSVTRDAENFRTCISGNYPSLCKHNLLTPREATRVAAAERSANFKTCISGNYPSLCKHNLLTSSEATQVAAAERSANLKTCLSGNYPSLCKQNLLTSSEATQVAAAERSANFKTCISGNYPSLCKHDLLTPSEATQVAAAERRTNFQTCISGNYPSLCKYSLLTSEEAARVAEAERRARR